MTNQQHPITAPTELKMQWIELPIPLEEVLDVATRWGADQELEACCKWLPKSPAWIADDLRRHRRPKPPSDKELALKALASIERTADAPVPTNKESLSLIRRALEALPE